MSSQMVCSCRLQWIPSTRRSQTLRIICFLPYEDVKVPQSSIICVRDERVKKTFLRYNGTYASQQSAESTRVFMSNEHS